MDDGGSSVGELPVASPTTHCVSPGACEPEYCPTSPEQSPRDYDLNCLPVSVETSESATGLTVAEQVEELQINLDESGADATCEVLQDPLPSTESSRISVAQCLLERCKSLPQQAALDLLLAEVAHGVTLAHLRSSRLDHLILHQP